MKYITGIVNGNFGPIETVIMFPDFITHSSMKYLFLEITSAGFVHGLEGSNVSAVGNSESLGVNSKPEDTEMIRRAINGY